METKTSQKAVNTESLSVLLHEFAQEEAADHVLKLMRDQHPSLLKLCDDKEQVEVLSDTVCQHVAELGLKEILDTIKSVPISKLHYFAGSVLVAIKDLYIVKKYLWKDKDFLETMCRLLEHSKNNQCDPLLRDIVICVIQGSLLGGTPNAYYESVANSNVIELFADILENHLEISYANSYEEIMMSLMLLCQNNTMCVTKCSSLSVTLILENFAHWGEIDTEIQEKALIASACIKHIANQDALPDHQKLLLDKFSQHMNAKNKRCKRLETIVCSNVECGKVEANDGERYKKCSQCRISVYCSKVCQKVHWRNGHSKVCKSPSTKS